ncbi:YidB family protein [Sedimenticola selenatireducens]|uniref:DUF937 domain-containing protein n=1 Tax=Sedimenticola selenatireducens TaxID=191960 RepID=A0A557S9K9_9GAMM|nr:YidB family protein [Sedimenticola selenatireducens]TVO74112.1 DUF937 domain-containing protein [Sedimenticola selenatireducens]TVT61632.1 MAG: DUF937 domain-containing protein [Sedimenticola selenatireducens]
MDLLKLGTELIMKKLGSNGNSSDISAALMGLLGGTDGKVDLAALISQFTQNSDLMGLASSWLGDGENQALSPNQLMSALGSDKIGHFADQLGISQGEAANTLSDTLPQLIDNSSSGGSLLDMAGDAGDLMGLAKKFF